MLYGCGGGWFTGVAPGLQNRCGATSRVPGGFDSRTLPPFEEKMSENLRNIPALHALLHKGLVANLGMRPLRLRHDRYSAKSGQRPSKGLRSPI